MDLQGSLSRMFMRRKYMRVDHQESPKFVVKRKRVKVAHLHDWVPTRPLYKLKLKLRGVRLHLGSPANLVARVMEKLHLTGIMMPPNPAKLSSSGHGNKLLSNNELDTRRITFPKRTIRSSTNEVVDEAWFRFALNRAIAEGRFPLWWMIISCAKPTTIELIVGEKLVQRSIHHVPLWPWSWDYCNLLCWDSQPSSVDQQPWVYIWVCEFDQGWLAYLIHINLQLMSFLFSALGKVVYRRFPYPSVLSCLVWWTTVYNSPWKCYEANAKQSLPIQKVVMFEDSWSKSEGLMTSQVSVWIVVVKNERVESEQQNKETWWWWEGCGGKQPRKRWADCLWNTCLVGPNLVFGHYEGLQSIKKFRIWVIIEV